MKHSLAVLAVIILGWPTDLPIQCEDSTYRRINPQVCGEQVFPFPGNNEAHGSGGNDGGLIGRILHAIGGLL